MEEKFKKARLLEVKITDLKKHIKVLELAISDNFKSRDISVNFYGTNNHDGHIKIPESVMKPVCTIALHASYEQLKKYEIEFDELFK